MSENFGSRLRAFRKKAGLTQPELADLVGVHETTIRRWENNGDKPMPDSFHNLAKALGVSEADLLNDSPPVRSGGWVINIKCEADFKKEVIDLTGNIQPIVEIITTPQGVAFTVKADWDNLHNDAGLKQLFKQIQKVFPAIRGQGIALGAIKD